MNGLIVLVACGLSWLDHRFVWLVAFMGLSLIYSGAADFCGFERIFERLRKND